MVYLLSQIAISLALAAIVGGAVGWLLHRLRTANHIDELQDLVERQQQHLSEAQTEVNILTADFDDLKQVSETQISKLKKDNRQIPALNQNLEKSQLLVRQLMEKHKTELDETNEENKMLLVKARQVDDREKEIIRLQAELDIERRNSARTSANQITNEISRDASATPEPVRSPVRTDSDYSAASAFLDNDSTSDSNDDTLPNTAQTQSELAELRDQLAEEIPTPDIDRESRSSFEQESNNNFVEVSPSSTGPHKLVETEVDDTDLEQMFDTVERHDDLKQIFGIGPVTEKTLNKLGITSYSQLAELKQHDIEKIANALQIFPGRIERDNWVGGARAQLEEVLEDL